MVEVQKLKTLTGHSDCIYTLIPGHQSGHFYSGAGDGMVVLWDLQEPDNGQLIAKVPNSIYALATSDDASKMIVGHNYDGIHIIDISAKKEIGSLKLTESAIFDIKVHGDRCFVATGAGEVFMVNISQPNPIMLGSVLLCDKSARSLAIDLPKGELAVGYSDHSIRILDIDTLQLKHTISGHTNSVFTVQYTPDYRYLLSAGRDARLNIWDTDTWQLKESIVAHMFAINHIAFSPNGKHFVTCSMDKSIKVWDASSFKLLKVIDKARHAGHGTSVNKVMWSNYNDQLVSGSDDRTLSVWDIKFKN